MIICENEILDSFYNESLIILQNHFKYKNLKKGVEVYFGKRLACIEELLESQRQNRVGIKLKYKN